MPWIILDREGSMRIKGVKLVPGANWVDDPDIVEAVIRKNRRGVTVSDTREQEPPPPPPVEAPSEPPEEPYERFLGRDGLWYYHRPAGAGQPVVQSEGYPDEEAVIQAIDADKEEASRITKAEDLDDSPEAGPLLPSELTDSTFECRDPDCDREFQSTGARRNHERIFHRKLSKGDAE